MLPPDPPARSRHSRPLLGTALVVAALVAGGAAIFAVSRDDAPRAGGAQERREGGEPRGDGGAIPADRLSVRTVDLPALAPEPGADGADGTLSVGVVGDAFVAIGALGAGQRTQAIFLRSPDRGLTWEPAETVDEQGLSAGDDAPYTLAAGPAGAIALGRAAGRVVTWTSADGRSWVRRSTDPMVFSNRDAVQSVSSGPAGFLAAGYTTDEGNAISGVLWDSPDGRQWRRRSAVELEIPAPPTGRESSFAGVASRDQVVVLAGSENDDLANPPTREVALWSSTDGGKSFSKIRLADNLGGTGTISRLSDVASGPEGFVAVGSGGDFSNEGYDAIALRSADGRTWTRAQDSALARKGEDFPAAVVTTSSGAIAVGSNAADATILVAEGSTWKDDSNRAAEVLTGPGVQSLASVAVLGDTTVAVGYDERTGDRDPLLVRRDGDGGPPVRVELPSVRALSAPAGSVFGLTSTSAGLVAVGASTGDGAVWRSTDGASFALEPGLRAGGSGDQYFSAVAASADGAQLFFAGARELEQEYGALALRSVDGTTFSTYRNSDLLEGDSAFSGRDLSAVANQGERTAWVGGRDEGRAESGAFVVTSRGGDSLVGSRSAGPRVKGSERTLGDGQVLFADDLIGGSGLDRLMYDVAFGPTGLVAVGLATPAVGEPRAPAAWSSPDGVTWALTILPRPAAFANAAMGDVVATPRGWAAVGSARRGALDVPLAWTSPDGINWSAPVELPQTAGASDYTSGLFQTPQGLVATGASTRDGDRDARLWTSVDGASWQAVDLPEPANGRGQQTLNDVTVQGDRVVAVGQAVTPEAARALVVTVPLPTLFGGASG